MRNKLKILDGDKETEIQVEDYSYQLTREEGEAQVLARGRFMISPSEIGLKTYKAAWLIIKELDEAGNVMLDVFEQLEVRAIKKSPNSWEIFFEAYLVGE